MKINNKWFTLIELLVSIAILSIIMISVFAVFFLSSDLNNKTDISRSMQENTKHIVETIAEDVRKNWIIWVQTSKIWDNCEFSSVQKHKKWTKICIWNWTMYYIAKKDWNIWSRVFDYQNDCLKDGENCTLVKNDWSNIFPLSNSWVEFEDLYFTVSWNKDLPLVNINFVLKPSLFKWVKPSLVKENKINFQTTVSWRLFKDY